MSVGRGDGDGKGDSDGDVIDVIDSCDGVTLYVFTLMTVTVVSNHISYDTHA